MRDINVLTVAIVCMFILPIIIGAFETFTKERIEYWFISLLDNIEFLLGLLLSIYLTRRIFFENQTGVFKIVYEKIPEGIRDILHGRDIVTYVVAVPIIMLVVQVVLRVLTTPLYRHVIIPLSDGIYLWLLTLNINVKRILGALWQVPKSLCIVFILGILLNFYSYYFPNPMLSKWQSESIVYQLIYKNALYPVLNSNIAKQIPVLVDDSFSKALGRNTPTEPESNRQSLQEQLAKKLNIRVIEYFNGVTLEEAIKSTPEINETAKKIVGSESSSKKKAYLIYKWVSKNIKYDYDKVARVSSNPSGISSGSVEAFSTRKGICFDYSCLYVSMCRAVGVKVRLVTGLGYSGVSWGDHAWNQVYCDEDSRWINVDCTFGTIGNYFDKSDFYVDHKYEDVQGEW